MSALPAALALALALAAPLRALEVPYLSGRVVDEAGMLTAEERRALEDKLRDFERRSGRQFAVLTLPSLEGEPLEDFSLKVARTWALGRKGKNDGLLLLVSREDRKLRIETGHGAEGDITDAQAGRIIRDVIVPRFRAGDFAGGLDAGVDAAIAAAEGRAPPEPATPERSGPVIEFDDAAGFGEDPLIMKLMISAFVFGILGLFEFVGIVAPGAGWFLYFFLIPFWAAFPMAIWGPRIGMGCLLAHLIGFPLIKSLLPSTPWGRKFRTVGNKTYYGDSLLFTQTSGGSSSGGGSSGGGFSGGGGSFGGGGASGSW